MWTYGRLKDEFLPGIVCALIDANTESYGQYYELASKHDEQLSKELINLFDSYVESSDQWLPTEDAIQFMRKFCESVVKNGDALLSQSMDKLLIENNFLND